VLFFLQSFATVAFGIDFPQQSHPGCRCWAAGRHEFQLCPALLAFIFIASAVGLMARGLWSS